MPRVMTQDEYNGDVSYKTYAEVATVALEHGHKYWVENTIPVPGSLAKFYADIKYKRRQLMPVINSRNSVRIDRPSDGEWYKVFERVCFAANNAPEFVVGSIWLDIDRKGRTTYCVESPKICNEKFAAYNKGYHQKVTTNYTTALKNALAYLKPWNMQDVRSDFEAIADQSLSSMKAPIESKFEEFVEEVKLEDILSEVTHMITAGYKPVTAHFNSVMAKLSEDGSELRRIYNYNPRTCWVWGRRDGTVMYQYSDEQECTINSVHELPDAVQDKIAVLQIADLHDAVMDVGVKIRDNVFCVFV